MDFLQGDLQLNFDVNFLWIVTKLSVSMYISTIKTPSSIVSWGIL